MKTFIQSELYKHFWIFILKSFVIVGMASLLGMVAASIVSGNILNEFAAFIYVFLIGGVYGFVAGIIGFLLVYTLLRLKVSISKDLLFGLIGLLLSIAVLTHFYSSDFSQLKFSAYSLCFPLIPVLVCIRIFIQLARKHIEPFA